MPQAGVTPLCGLNLGAEHRDTCLRQVCSKFIENKILIEAFFIGLITVVTSSIYPAVKAARMNIVDAIRFA